MRRYTSFALTMMLAAACSSATEPVIRDLDDLGGQLESLRKQYNIPALAVGVMDTDGSTWFRGLGHTPDGSAPTAQSVFHLASLTKSFASAIMLQLQDEGKLLLTDNVSKYGLSFPNSPNVLVLNLMTHTSEGTPGESYLYNGNRYGQLDPVIARASGKTFVELANERIIAPLGLTCTGASTEPTLRARLVGGFSYDGKQPLAYPTHVSSAAGIVSCVQDMLTYSSAWDSGKLLKPADVVRAWTPMQSSKGVVFPYALGWFVTEMKGQQIVWHYGNWTGISSLIIKVPARHLTYVLLANSEGLSREFNLGAGDLASSPFARAFLAWAGVL